MATTGGFAASSREGGFAGAGTSRLESPAQRASVNPGAGNITAGRIAGGGGGNDFSRSPLAVYGNEFTFTEEELKNAALSGAPAIWGSRLNPSVLDLMAIQKKTNASPELQGIAAAIRAPFMAGYQAPPAPAGLLDSAVSTATSPSGSFQGFGLPEIDLSSPITSPNPDVRYNELYSSLPSVAPLMGVAPTDKLADYMYNPTMTTGPRVGTAPSQTVMPPSGMSFNGGLLGADTPLQGVAFDGVQQSVLPDLAFGNPADSLAEYGWMLSNPKLPAGMRNFNPGNLKYTGSDWQSNNLFGITGPSVNTDQGEPQIQFSDPVSGMASAVRLALAKQSQGMDTVSKIITNQNGWTPGNTAAANNIAKTMGVDPNQQINLQDPVTMDKFMKALVRQEHGPSSSQYGQDVYNAGINVAFNAYGLGNPKLGDALNQVATKSTSPSGSLLGGSRAEANLVAAAPSPAPVQTAAPQEQARVAATPSLPPRTPTPSLLGRFATAITGIPGYDTGPGLLSGGFKPAEIGTQILAGAQPQVVEAASALEPPPVNRPKAEPTRLASLLFDRAVERARERGGEGRRDRRRKKPSTTTEQTMSDTIEGLLA